MSETVLDPTRLDRLFQYAVAIAAQSEDYKQRELGPIHILKYAYLADLAHASRHDGATYSGTDWTFHHFGPWSVEAFQRIAPSVTSSGATPRTFSSRYADDAVRYKLDAAEAEHLARRLERDLPGEVTSAISRAVHDHGTDTGDLLRFVYLTPPMLNASPGSTLDLSIVVAHPSSTPVVGPETPAKLSSKDKRLRKTVLEAARAEIQRRLKSGATTRLAPSPAPRYDEVFFEGTAQLDRAAGEPVAPSSGNLDFDNSIWLSALRREPEIS